jgi:hypothetical protein
VNLILGLNYNAKALSQPPSRDTIPLSLKEPMPDQQQFLARSGVAENFAN